MIDFTLEHKTYSMPTDWHEISMAVFLRFQKIIELNNTLPIGDEILMQQLLEALCNVQQGEFDDIDMQTVLVLKPYLDKLNTDFPKSDKTSWVVDGVEYTYHTDPNKYTLSDFADIKTLQRDSKHSLDYLADIAAIMIRPSVKCLDGAGNEFYKLVKRTPETAHKNRAAILKIGCVCVMTVLNFFLTSISKQH